MAKNKDKRRERTADEPDERSSALGRNAKIWLATLSTVIGVATGMFTLRDQVFPGEAGWRPRRRGPHISRRSAASATSSTTWTSGARRRTRRSSTSCGTEDHDRPAQRAVGRCATDRRALGGCAGLVHRARKTPRALVATRRESEAAWNRNLARLRNYALRLDHAGTRPQLVKAIDHLSNLRPVLAADGVKVRSGLERSAGRTVTSSRPG